MKQNRRLNQHRTAGDPAPDFAISTPTSAPALFPENVTSLNVMFCGAKIRSMRMIVIDIDQRTRLRRQRREAQIVDRSVGNILSVDNPFVRRRLHNPAREFPATANLESEHVVKLNFPANRLFH